jgi:hypothetical protein
VAHTTGTAITAMIGPVITAAEMVEVAGRHAADERAERDAHVDREAGSEGRQQATGTGRAAAERIVTRARTPTAKGADPGGADDSRSPAMPGWRAGDARAFVRRYGTKRRFLWRITALAGPGAGNDTQRRLQPKLANGHTERLAHGHTERAACW